MSNYQLPSTQSQGGLSHLCRHDNSHTCSCGKLSKLVMGVRLSKGENRVKTVSTLFHVALEPVINVSRRKSNLVKTFLPNNLITENTAVFTRMINLCPTQQITVCSVACHSILVHMDLVQQKSSLCLQPLHTTKEKTFD